MTPGRVQEAEVACRSTVDHGARAGQGPRMNSGHPLGRPTGAPAEWGADGACGPPTWRTGSGLRNLQQLRVRRTADSRLILWPTET